MSTLHIWRLETPVATLYIDILSLVTSTAYVCVFVIHVQYPIRARLPVTEHKLAIHLGKKYTAEEAKTAGIVNEVSSLEELKDSAVAAANKLAGDGLDRKTLATIKHDVYRDVYQALNEPVRVYSLL